MRLRPGLKVGPYEVLAPLGAGGMAEVYRARDTRLGRDIALKVVNEVLSGDPELVRRFEQEACLAGSLNHPNLVSVHDVGVHEGVPYFVTELLEGESLRHRMSRGRVPPTTALEWASQMASGLAAAHGKGVIHRDVKPDNVFVTADGNVKLLDFGIAKLAAAASNAGPHGMMDDTVTPTGRGATATGAVLGTPGYMSPEQIRGESVDSRTDIFSLGAVLYEMLAGRRAFQGANPVESGYRILHTDPEALPPDVPLAVTQVVQRCLQKEPARRFQSASDLGFALDVVRGPGTNVTAGPGPRRPRRAWVRLLGGLAVVAGAVLAAVLVLRRPAGHAAGPELPEAEQITSRWGQVHAARFLPDGRVVYSASFEGRPEEVFVRAPSDSLAQSLALYDTRLLAASPSGELAVLVHPRFPLGFLPAGTVARVPSVGGIPREVSENAELADWAPGGELAIVHESELGRALEFPPGHILFRTGGWISQLRFSPAGDRIALLHHPIPFDDMGEVVVVDLEGRARTLTKRWPTSWGLAWSPDGREVWFSAGVMQRDTVHAVTLEGSIRELYRNLGEVRLEDVAPDGRALLNSNLNRIELAYRPSGSASETLLSWSDHNDPLAALSMDGKLLFSNDQPNQLPEGMQRAWVLLRSKDGSPAQVLGEGFALDLSRDGRWALAQSEDGKKLTALPTGAGRPRPIPMQDLEVSPRGGRWAPDGKTVLVAARPPGGKHVQLHRLMEDGTAVRVSEIGLFGQPWLVLSPDGRWAAALDEQLRTVVISLADGAARRLPLDRENLVAPQGWPTDGQLWVTAGGGSAQSRSRLLRVDSQSGKVLEERGVGPVDPGGASGVIDVAVSSDGQGLAFTYARRLGTLYLVRGLGQSRPELSPERRP